MANISNFACQACLPVWPTRQTLLYKHSLVVSVFETFQKRFLFVTSKSVCQARVCVVAKPTNIVFDKQNFKCLSNNVCPFGRDLSVFTIDCQCLKVLNYDFFDFLQCVALIWSKHIKMSDNRDNGDFACMSERRICSPYH